MATLTWNIIFYTIKTLASKIIISFPTYSTSSSSLTSLIPSSTYFKHKIIESDINNKLSIIESLIYTIINKYCTDNEEFEYTKKHMLYPDIEMIDYEFDDFVLLKSIQLTVLERMNAPTKLAVLSVIQIIEDIKSLIIKINAKITKHEKSFKIFRLSLTKELLQFNEKLLIFDSRVHLFLELLKL